MRNQPNNEFIVEPKFHFPADDTAAVITLAAAEGVVHVIDSIDVCYDAAPTDGLLTVAFGGTTKFQVPITDDTPHDFTFDNGLTNNTENEAVVITLAAGGTGIAGFLNAQVR